MSLFLMVELPQMWNYSDFISQINCNTTLDKEKLIPSILKIPGWEPPRKKVNRQVLTLDSLLILQTDKI